MRPVPEPGDSTAGDGPRKAYEDLDFLRSAEARTIRVIAELLAPQYRLANHDIRDTIVFFGSARIPDPARAQDGPDNLARLASYYTDAQELARRLTEWSLQRPSASQFVVCSGGGPGIMEAANRGAQEAGGPTVGMGISIPCEPSTNTYVTPDLAFEFHYFFVRKFHFLYNAKALVFFPGGFGTIDEMMELLTLMQTQKVRKRMGVVLYGRGYWESVINFDAMVRHGVISAEDRDLFVAVESVDAAFIRICSFLEENYGGTLLEED